MTESLNTPAPIKALVSDLGPDAASPVSAERGRLIAGAYGNLGEPKASKAPKTSPVAADSRPAPAKPKLKTGHRRGIRAGGVPTKHGRPTYNQAAKVIARFGGEPVLAELLGVHRCTLYRWNYRAPYGSDGLIPVRMVEKVNRAARIEGIVITDDDWVPERLHYDDQSEETEARPLFPDNRDSIPQTLEA